MGDGEEGISFPHAFKAVPTHFVASATWAAHARRELCPLSVISDVLLSGFSSVRYL